MTKEKHWLGRPPEGVTDVLRLAANGQWYPDDGESLGLAFSGKHSKYHGVPIAWVPDCDCWNDKCPKRRAMRKTCDRFRCANGFDMLKPRKRK